MNFDEERQLRILDSMIQIAVTGFKLLTLLNGGAAVALLAYLGNIATNNSTGTSGTVVLPPDLRWPMCFFILGLLSCMGAVAFAYRTQYLLGKEKAGTAKAGAYKKWLILAAVLCSLSIISFGVGSFWTAAIFH